VFKKILTLNSQKVTDFNHEPIPSEQKEISQKLLHIISGCMSNMFLAPKRNMKDLFTEEVIGITLTPK
jgi:hypothetical protein